MIMSTEIKELGYFQQKIEALLLTFDDLKGKVDEAMCLLSFLSAKYDELNSQAINIQPNIKG